MGVVLALALPLLVAACGGSASSSTDAGASSASPSVPAFVQWNDGGGQTYIHKLAADSGQIAAAASRADSAALSEACTQERQDAGDAQAYGPIPDEAAQSEWSVALDSTVASSSDCIAGVAGMDAGLISKSNNETNEASRALLQVNARLKVLSATPE